MDLSKYIGEITFYDKKIMLEEKKSKSWLKSISAFANTKGGKLLFGIDDNDELIGLKNAKKDAESISEIIKTKLDPIPRIELEIIDINSKNIIVLTIFEGNETPYYLIENGSRVAYVRIGNESVISNGTQLKKLVLKGLNRTYDSLSTNIRKDRASFTKLKAIYYQKTLKD